MKDSGAEMEDNHHHFYSRIKSPGNTVTVILVTVERCSHLDSQPGKYLQI